MKACQKASYLISKQLDTQLSVPEKWALKLHLALCHHCRLCNKQLKQVHKLTHQRHNPD